MQWLYDGFNALKDMWEFALFLWIAVSITVSFIVWLCFFAKKERRLFKNLKRKIHFLKIPNAPFNLENELQLTRDNGFFKTDDQVREYSNTYVDNIKGQAVIVISYSPSFDQYQSLINSLKAKNFPLVILAKFDSANKITDPHQEIFDQYAYYQVCNGTSRLLTSIFSICAVTPYEKK